MSQPEAEEVEETVVAFDKLFSGLSDSLPLVCWQLICGLLGKEPEKPSDESHKQMKAAWSTFFKACGVQYVGQGFNLRLSNPLWLILIPIVGTISALI